MHWTSKPSGALGSQCPIGARFVLVLCFEADTHCIMPAFGVGEDNISLLMTAEAVCVAVKISLKLKKRETCSRLLRHLSHDLSLTDFEL